MNSDVGTAPTRFEAACMSGGKDERAERVEADSLASVHHRQLARHGKNGSLQT